VINLITNDINRFDTALHMIHFLWIGPLQTIVATYFLWREIGMSSLIGIATFFFFIPLQGLLNKSIFTEILKKIVIYCFKFRLDGEKNI